MDDEEQGSDVTLSTGKLLFLFLGLVVVCALFFGFGYSMGRGSAKIQGNLNNQAPNSTLPVANDASKPGAAPCTPAPVPAAASAQSESELTQSASEPEAQPVAAPAAKPDKGSAKNDKNSAKTDKNSAKNDKNAVKDKGQAKTPPPAAVGGFMVQVAAVSQRADADRLRTVLEHKQYPVVILPGAGDKLLHVQVGPVGSAAEAESLKKRLTADGYNPIIKH